MVQNNKKILRISFWYLQFTHKSEMTLFKKSSKCKISLRTAVIKIFKFWQNFDSTSNLHKSFQSTKEHVRIQYSYLQITHNTEITMFKKWSKSEISLITAVIKIFNFWQNFYSTSNFQKWFRTTKKHFGRLFWYLQFTHKSEMAMFKKWSKSEILLRNEVMKIFNFWQNFDSTSNFHKSFKWTKEHFRIQYSYLQINHKSELTMLKKWSKSEISLRTSFMKIFNFWQNSDSTSNFQKWLKTTKKHFRISFCYLQFTHKSEMTMFKKWSKSEISLRTSVMKIFNFWQNFDSTSNFQKWLKPTNKHFSISFWYLQFTHKSELTMFKKW